MEWYSGSCIEDIIVPGDEKNVMWSPWGKMPKKHAKRVEEPLFSEASFYSKVDQLTSEHDFHQPSSYPHEHSDVRVSDFARFEEEDDIFFHSLFKADASEIHGANSSANPQQGSNKNNGSPLLNAKEPEFEIRVSENDYNFCEYIDEEIFLEGSVLLELQRSTSQLTEEIRTCFRNSLYRLAENSRQQTSCSQDVEMALEDCKPDSSSATFRFEDSNVKASNRNAIDRTVATLLFNNMNFHNHTSPSTLNLAEKTKECEVYSNQPNSFSSSMCTDGGGDAEVPTFGMTY